MTTTTEALFLSIEECAKRLGISEDTLGRHIRPALLSGAIFSLKIGSRRVISWQSLLSYLAEHHNGALT